MRLTNLTIENKHFKCILYYLNCIPFHKYLKKIKNLLIIKTKQNKKMIKLNFKKMTIYQMEKVLMH